MKKITLFTIILILTARIGFAGNDFNIDTEFPKRKLLIVLAEEDPARILELTKGGKTEDITKYKESIKKYNENLQFAFKEYWKDKPTDFVLESKVQPIKCEELTSISVLTSQVRTIEGLDFYVYTLNTVYSETNKKGKIKYYSDARNFRVNLQNEIPSKADLMFLISSMKIYFKIEKAFDREQLEETLAKKTLLLNKESVQLTDAEIKEEFAFPYKLVSPDEIFNMAEKNDANSLYLKLGLEYVDKMGLVINFMVIDCGTGKILSRSRLVGLTKVSWNMPSPNSMKNQQFFDESMGYNTFTPYISGIGFVGKEIARLYTAKAKLKSLNLRHMSSEKKQSSYFKNLMLY